MNIRSSFDIYLSLLNNKERVYKNFEEVENGASFEPPYTTFNFKRNETIDYIFYNNHAFQVKSLIEIPSLQFVGHDEGPSEWINSDLCKQSENKNGIPNRFFPSDHLPIVSILQLK